MGIFGAIETKVLSAIARDVARGKLLVSIGRQSKRQ